MIKKKKKINKKWKLAQTTFFDIRGYFEITVPDVKS